MNILLTNDDGYGATGIELLKNKLKKYGNVYVVAPTFHQSGASMGFSILKGFTIKKYNDFEYSIDGRPTDVVLLAVMLLKNVKFDLIVSGCNSGLNISYDSLYSGTLGAALEGLNRGIPSIAISTDIDHFSIVEKEVEQVLDYLINHKLYSKDYCLNVNFPLKDFKESKGIKLCTQYFRKDEFYTWEKNGYTYVDRNEYYETEDEESDVYAVSHGYIALTPLHNSFYCYSAYEKLKKVL